MKLLNKFGIRGKILISVTIFLVLFFIFEGFIFYNVFLGGFKDVEQQDMVSDMQRVEGLINDQINNYSVKLSDWSNWDDTYNFVIDKNPVYVESNLTDLALVNLRLNFMVFIASNGAIVEEKGISFQTGKDIPIPKDLHYLLSKPGIITTHETLDSKSQGIIRLSNSFIIFASRPILTSNADGPSRGTLIFARYIDKDFLTKIAALEQSKIQIQDYYSNSLSQEFVDAKRLMSIEGIHSKEPNGKVNTYFVNRENANIIAGFTIIKDINNKNVFIIENELPRTFYKLGTGLVSFALLLFGIVSLFSLVFEFLLLNNLVISKITKLNKDVTEVKNPNNPKARLDIKGHDELTNLASNINTMLDEIMASKEDLEKFKQAIENTSDHVIITDSDGKIIYANKATENLTGFSKEEIIGNTPRLWGKQMPKEFYLRLWDTIKTKKQAFADEITNKKKTGELYTVEARITPILDEASEIKFFVGVERDLSAEKKLANQLLNQNQEIEKQVSVQTKEISEEKSRLFKFLDAMPEGVFVLDTKGKPFYANFEAKRLLGKSIIDAEPSDFSEIYHTYIAGTNKLYPWEQNPIVQALSGKNTSVRDIEVRHEEKVIPLEISGAPIIDQDGNIIFAIAVFKDITEEKTLERSKDEFFSIASHELRTPLTAIRGNTSLIKQYYQDKLGNDKDLNEMIDDIHASSIRLIQIVNDFLNVSRLEQGKMEFKLENFDILELIKKKIAEIESLVKEKNLAINIDSTTQLTQIYADKDRLGEVILNLLGNAIKYSEKGTIGVKITEENNYIKTSVSDTGRGVSREQQKLLFKKFQQAGESLLTRDTTRGTGLGLYISKLIIEQMGGKIQLESSEENKGSVFSFIVPVAK